MDNRFGLKAVENQNEFTEQAIEPKRQFETQLDTPLTMGEYNALNNIYQNSDDKERDVIRFGQALEYKRNFGIDIDYAFNNLPSLNEMRGIPQEYNWSTFSAIKNSFKISALNDKLADLNSQWMDADMAGSDLTEIEKQIADTENQIEGLRDYAPRSLLTNMMKWAGESSVFTGVTMLDSLTYGAGTALTLAGFAALMGAPITATAIGGAMTWAGISSLSAGMAKLGGTISVANKTKGTMYRELRKQGVEKNLAKSASSINGYVNGLIETSLGVVPAGVGSVLKATGVEQLTATTMARLAMRGTWGAMGKMLANHVVDSVEEGEEEFLQSLTDDITDAIVLTMSEECQKNGVTFDKSVRDVVTDAIKAGGQGFGAALIMSVPSTAVNTRIGVKAAKQLKAEAKLNPSEESFVRNHMNDEAFEGVDKKDVKEMLREMYQNQNEVPADERIDESTIDSDTIEENVDIESEEDEAAVASEAPEKDIERMENGRLRTQEEKDYDVDIEGNEKHTLKVGTPNSSTRYGRVEYTVRKDGSIEIDKVATKAGYAKSVTKDAVLELMRRYAGQDVVWNPTNAYQQKIKAELENENNGTLQRFKSQYNQSEEAELGDYLHEKYKQITPSQGKILYKLYDNIAKAYGSTIHEMIQDARSGNPKSALRFATMAEGVKSGAIKAENAVGKRGAVDYANRIIYVGEHGDITTLFHEGFHILTKVDKEGAKNLVKSILESKELEGYIKSHRAFFVPQLSMTTEEIMKALSNLSEDSAEWTEDQDEILTSLFEAYLRNGKTFSKELENIFSRIADFFIQIYKTLAGGKHLSDDIIKAFDQILEGNPELKAKYEAQEGTRFQSPSAEDVAEADRQYAEVEARYKGTDQWMKAPNGQPTKLTERQWVQVRTPLFKAWFGDWENDPDNASKVVDENGEPRVVYHGTGDVFDVFDTSLIGSASGDVGWFGKGFYFSFWEGEAQAYDSRRIVNGFINIRNPLYFIEELTTYKGERSNLYGVSDLAFVLNLVDKYPELTHDHTIEAWKDGEGKELSFEEFAKQAKDIIDNKTFKIEEIKNEFGDTEYLATADPKKHTFKDVDGKTHTYTDYGFQQRFMSKEDAENKLNLAYEYLNKVVYDGIEIPKTPTIVMETDFNDAVKAKGYDGVIQSKEGDEIAVFDPTQIKSATDNVGTFSESNPSILFQRDAEYEEAVKNGDMAKAQAMVDARAREMGYNSPKLYHGTKQFGFTTVDVSKSDDQVSFFATDRLETAETYSGEETATSIGKRKQISEIKEEINQNADKMLDLLKKIAPKKFGRFTISDIANEIISNIEWENFNSIGFDPFFGLSKLYELFNMAVSDNENLSKLSVGDLDQTQEYKTYSKIFDDIAKVLTESAGNYSLYAKTDKFLKIDAKGANWNKIILPKNIQNRLKKYQVPNWQYYQEGGYEVQVKTRELSYFAKQLGYRGVEIKNVRDNGGRGYKYNGYLALPPATVYIFFNPQSQVKSADPVTYDDNGQVIPLSQRFNDSHSSLLFQSAYHGSGASFDKFDTDFMGTGEGAQAFGWGIYLTQSEGIARSYAEQRHSNIVYKGDNFNALWNKEHTPEVRAAYQIIDSMESGKTFQEAKETVLAADKEAIEALREPLEDDTGEIDWDEQIKRYEEDIDALEKLEETDFSQRKRNLYTVSIPDDNGSNYLYWDKNVSDSQLNTIIENLKKDPTADKQLLTLFENAMKKGKKSWVKWREGANVYEHIKEILGSPENASKFLSSLGYVGIDYPANSMSGGNKYGKRNFVIFNADDINIQTHIRYQNRLTEDERSQLVEEARDFDTFDDFLNYLSIMNGWLDPEQYTDALPVLDEIYSEAHGITRDKQKVELDLSGMTDDQKDRAFEEYIDGDGIKVIMSLLHDMYTTHYGYTYAHGALEDEEIAEEESLMARIREFEDNASSFIYNLAKSKKELTDKQFNSIRNVIKKNTRMYRELIADTLESETLRSDAEPDIAGVRSEGRPTLADRETLEKDAKVTLDDKVEGEIEKKLSEVESELDKDEKAARALESEIDSLMGELKGELTEEEQKALKNIQFLERFRGRKDHFAEALKKKIDNGEAISQAENTRLDNLAKQIKELEKALDNFNTKQKAKNYIDKQNALKKLRKEIREKQKQKRALKELHEYKGRLVKYLQKKVPKSVAYEYKGMIEAIISMFSDVSGYDNNITYRGKSLTPKEFREAVDRDGSLDELSKYYIRRYEKKSLADYTVEELEHMADVKRRLVDVGRQMWQAKVDARNAEAAQIRQIILNHLRQSPKFSTAPLPDTQEDKKGKKTFRKKFNELFTRTIPMSRITQMLDGNQKGFVYELLTRDKRLVQDMERLAVRERINKVKDLMEELGVKNEDFYQTAELSIRQSDDLEPTDNIEKFTDTYTLSQLIYGLYAQKNARNRLAFMFGDLVTQDDKAALNHNNDLIYDLGMKRNDRFVKQAEAILEKHPKLKQVAEAIVSDWQDMNNKTRLNQVMIDEYNQGLDMEEFYMPIKRLDFNGTSLAQSIADDVFNQNAGKGMTTPKKGMTFARIDITPDQQMRTNMDFLELWLNSVDEQEHLIATNAYVRKLNRVFKGRGNNDLRSAIENVYGKHINEDIDKYINEIANPPATMEDRNVSKWIRFLRGRLYEAYLGFKLSSFVLQVITSPAPFLREVNAIQLSENILKVMAKPSECWKFIAERSPMMESRSIDPMLADIKKEAEDATANKFVRGYRKTLAFGTGLLEVADRWMVSAGWLACFEKAMNERQEAIENGDITQLQAEVEASRYADEVVLESQPTGDSTELSPLFKTKSAAWNALTQFTTSLNVIWTNLMYDSVSDLRNRNFKRAILTAFAYALAGTVLYAVQDYEPPEDDEHWIKDTILKLLYGMTSQGFSSVPLIGSGIEKFSKQLFTGEKQLMTQRVFPAFETTREALERLAQGKMDEKTVRKAIEAIGLFTGLPVSGTKELEHIFRDRNGNWRYKGKRITDNDILNWIMAEKWQSVVGRRDNYGNKQRRK